ncbi:MAG: type II/IV secretion system protein [Chloroflexi bacterium]|nr:MAG: type II/IV secretion system protein [Chloroflexota bacterium]
MAADPVPSPVERVDLSAIGSQSEALELVPEEYAIQHVVLPLTVRDDLITVACADPGDMVTVRDIQVLTRRPVEALAADPASINEAIRQRYKVLANVDRHVQAFSERAPNPIEGQLSALETISAASPVVQIVNLVLKQGLRDRASDIHIEPQEDRLRIRFRIDGLLVDALTLPKTMAPSLASRIKVMANMDIVDRHRAQDGQLRVEQDGRNVDVRVATTETIWGEKVVLRLLDQGRTVLSLDELGLADHGYRSLAKLLRSPYGMIIVSGPTGSGKTTSLYAAIKELDPVAQNIMTIEDPVEYTFPNINQIQIRRMANLTFANGLKAILRQDPDVILVGEIRDLETAEIAVQSALTGHLVLSSLHATDAAGVIQRFIEMGVEGFLLSSSLIGVVAQRLVRRNCTYCQEPYQPSIEERQLWAVHRNELKPVFFRGRGCNHCAGTGYRGRVGVFEVLQLSDGIKRLISQKASGSDIRALAQEEGMVDMRTDGIAKVEHDMTTLSEVIRCVWMN